MLQPQEIEIPPEKLKSCQIIAIALPAGAISFLMIVCFLIFQQGGIHQGLGMMAILSVAFGASLSVIGWFLPPLIAQQQTRSLRRRDDNGAESNSEKEQLHSAIHAWMGAYLNYFIIGSAIFEGAAFLAIVSFMVEKSIWALVVGVVAILILLWRFPTESRVQDWIFKHWGGGNVF